MPIASAANFAQGAACLAVGLKSRNHKTKAVAIPSSLSAALGITEPAIFGVNLRFMKPLLCGMAGGACGAVLGAIFRIGATSYGVTGLPGFLITLDYTAQYAIVLAVSFVVSFVLTWILWKEEAEEEGKAEKKAKEQGHPAGKTESRTEKAEEQKGQNSSQKNNSSDSRQKENAVIGKLLAALPPLEAEPGTLYAPVKGNVIGRDAIPDETFASGMLGDGVGIEPEIGLVVAPCDGEIASLTDTRHAIGMVGAGGLELLIHVGVDTVNMKGDGFELFVKMGDKVKAGQKLLTFDIEKIKAAGYSTTTAVLVANTYNYSACKVEKTGRTELMEKIVVMEE